MRTPPRSGWSGGDDPPDARSRVSSIACIVQRSSDGSVGDADECEALVVSLHHPLEDLADSGPVVLPLGLRLDRAELARDDRMPEGAVGHGDAARPAEHPSLIHRLAGRVVL